MPTTVEGCPYGNNWETCGTPSELFSSPFSWLFFWKSGTKVACPIVGCHRMGKIVDIQGNMLDGFEVQILVESNPQDPTNSIDAISEN